MRRIVTMRKGTSCWWKIREVVEELGEASTSQILARVGNYIPAPQAKSAGMRHLRARTKKGQANPSSGLYTVSYLIERGKRMIVGSAVVRMMKRGILVRVRKGVYALDPSAQMLESKKERGIRRRREAEARKEKFGERGHVRWKIKQFLKKHGECDVATIVSRIVGSVHEDTALRIGQRVLRYDEKRGSRKRENYTTERLIALGRKSVVSETLNSMKVQGILRSPRKGVYAMPKEEDGKDGG